MGVAGLWSCASENPFDTEGSGTLRLKMVVNHNVTRSDAETELDYLSKNCVLYISDSQGLLYKYKGIENIPETLKMRTGNYVAEAWTGDSVPASFDKKFYRGYEPFEISSGENSVVINCKIRNVVTALDITKLEGMVNDLKVTVENSTGSLEYSAAEGNLAERGYFMMPGGDTSISYTIEGTNLEGKTFTKEGVIEDVESAHLYTLQFDVTPSETVAGGAFINIVVKDEDMSKLNESEVTIKSAATIEGVEFDIAKQLQIKAADQGNVGQRIIKISAFGKITGLRVTSDDYSSFGLPARTFDYVGLPSVTLNALENAGMTFDEKYNEQADKTNCYITLDAQMLNRLPVRDEEYSITFDVTDSNRKTSSASFRIAIGEGAFLFEDPIVIEPADDSDWEAVKAHSVTLSLTLTAEVSNPGVEYRKAGSSDDWTFVALGQAQGAAARRAIRKASAASQTITLTGLEPNTEYEYRVKADDFEGEVYTFTTATTFTIPDAGMEEWAQLTVAGSKDIWTPTTTGTLEFWGTGNPGAAKAGEVLTSESSDMFHHGAKSAKLESKFASVLGIGKFAAGNLFAGTYDKTDGTDGVLTFGRPYDGSHPSALRVWVNYRPAKVQSNSVSDYLKAGDMDQGQIYVALATEAQEIRTKSSNQKLFSADAASVIAYGQQTFTANYGDDGALKELVIPIEYFARAKNATPTHLIIVCSASKFGDFFSGGAGSTMYLDDFELVYE